MENLRIQADKLKKQSLIFKQKQELCLNKSDLLYTIDDLLELVNRAKELGNDSFEKECTLLIELSHICLERDTGLVSLKELIDTTITALIKAVDASNDEELDGPDEE
jgi:hypothetical protein